eukprot:TRINITY_DN92201_c0_g1_i1.p1 TRINITY_DN92201_c0_g1~~TRINITY_DN92201_c0_g1_i1.p1  ORF type:complete len:732 (-),score=154.27 TRINITY_DN92201_c0_g1_i1:204-2153(-)
MVSMPGQDLDSKAASGSEAEKASAPVTPASAATPTPASKPVGEDLPHAAAPASAAKADAPIVAVQPTVQQAALAASTQQAVQSEEKPRTSSPSVSDGPPPLNFVPVGATEAEIEGLFKEYEKRVSRSLSKTLDSSWQCIEKEKGRAQDSGEPMQWFWLADPEVASPGPRNALGLVVFWLMRGVSACHGIISHLSFTEGQDCWEDLLPGVLDALRIQLFQSMPISSIRVTLWLSPQQDKTMKINKDVETPVKQAGYRWFQLANTKDSRRGQVMALRRVEERDGPAPADFPDLYISSCMMLPQRLSNQVVEESAYDEVACNVVVFAECLRKHTLRQEVRVEDAVEVSPEASAQATSGVGLAQGVLQRLEKPQEGKKSGISLVRTLLASGPQACEAFAAETLKGVDSAASLLQWLCRVTSSQDGKADGASGQAQEASKANRVLCGGLVAALNWKDQREDPYDSRFSRVAVQATGGQESHACKSNPVAYLATEDDEICAMVWKLTDDLKDVSDDGLYEIASRLIREAAPSATGADRAVSEVALPKMQSCLPASTEVAMGTGKGLTDGTATEEAPTGIAPLLPSEVDFAASREIMGLRFSSRATPPGALLSSEPEAPPEKVLCLDSSFLFAVWHDKYEHLQVPLFVARIRPDMR